jgi:hypothetical protein
MANFRSPLPLGMPTAGRGQSLETSSPAFATQSRKTTGLQEGISEPDIEFLGPITDLRDGDLREFDVSDYAMFFLTDQSYRKVTRSRRSGTYPVLFVNGMQGSPVKFRAQACAVAALSGGPVWGVYNGSGSSFLFGDNQGDAQVAPLESGNIFTDLIECATDKLQSTDLDQFKAWLKKKTGMPQSQIENEMYTNLNKYNRATGSLYRKLLEPGFEHARIVAHSQGNIITCNAVNAVAAVRGKKAIAKMRIEAVASPVVFWSEAGMFGQDIVSVHALANDFVAWLGANITDAPFLALRKPIDRGSLQGSEISDRYAWTARPDHLLTHNFYAYLEKLWLELSPEFP